MIKPESETKIADMFNRIAPQYDFLNRLLSARQDIRWRKHLVSMFAKPNTYSSVKIDPNKVKIDPNKVKIDPNKDLIRVLDMATGTGEVLIEAHKQLGERAQLFGGDISSEMIEIGKTKLRSISGCNSEMSIMSAEKILYPDSSFDVLTIAFGLRNVVQKDRAIAEFARVLKPNGRLFVLEFFIPNTGFFGRVFQLYFQRILPVIGGLFSDKTAYSYLPKSVASSYSLEKLVAVMANKGLKAGRTKNFLFGACKIVEGIKV